MSAEASMCHCRKDQEAGCRSAFELRCRLAEPNEVIGIPVCMSMSEAQAVVDKIRKEKAAN